MLRAREIETQLRRIGKQPDEQIDIARTALLLSALDRPGVALARYEDHLALLVADLAKVADGAESLDDRVAALNSIMFTAYGYEGDRRTYDDLQNASLMRVIDRRRGLPVALGILCIHAARAQGWTIAGLNFPGHFLLRMDHAGQRVILDPFARGAQKTAADLRELLKAQHDEEAELAPGHYDVVADRDILLRLQNNIKLRQTQRNDNQAAADTLARMLWIAPENKMLWREKALTDAQLGRVDNAVAALEEYIARETLDGPRHDAALLLQKLRGKSG